MSKNHGKLLDIRIKLSGMSQTQIGHLVGKTRQAVSQDTKKVSLGDDMINSYGRVLGFTKEEFINELNLTKASNDSKEIEILQLQLEAVKKENEHLKDKLKMQEEIFRLKTEKEVKSHPITVS